MVRPSQPDLEVVGVFNPGVIRHGREVVLLLRVAEAPPRRAEHEAAAPVYDPRTGALNVRRWDTRREVVDRSDPRTIVFEGRTWLTSISHLRVARSVDGVHFDVERQPALSAATELESFGLEDPRITLIDDTYWINYTAVSPYGIATALASTRDFKAYRRHGVIFPPPNRDVTIFPIRIGGRYAALHRPMPEGIGEHAIWIGWSPDLMTWGDHDHVASARSGHWDDAKVGGGAVPFPVRVNGSDAWLAVYHGVSRSPRQYSLGALLLDTKDPGRVIGRSRAPILSPTAPYEREGFFKGVVFTCGVLAENGGVRVYYGAADGVTAVADVAIDDILGDLD